MRKVLKVLVDKRFAILAVSGATIYYVLTQYHISLWLIMNEHFYGVFGECISLGGQAEGPAKCGEAG